MKFAETSGKDHYGCVVLHKVFYASELHLSAINEAIPDNVILKGKISKQFALVCQKQA